MIPKRDVEVNRVKVDDLMDTFIAKVAVSYSVTGLSHMEVAERAVAIDRAKRAATAALEQKLYGNIYHGLERLMMTRTTNAIDPASIVWNSPWTVNTDTAAYRTIQRVTIPYESLISLRRECRFGP